MRRNSPLRVTIFAWTGALKKNGEKDQNDALIRFAEKLEDAVISTLDEGFCTKDLYNLYEGIQPTALSTAEFLQKVREAFEKAAL